MGRLVKINNRKLNRSSRCLLVQLKGLVSTPVLTCRMDGWICVDVPGLHCSVLCMFSTFRLTLFRWEETTVQVSSVYLPLFFSTLLWVWWSLLRVQSGVRDMLVCMSGSLLNLLLHACVGLLHQYMWTSCVCVEVSHLQSFPPSPTFCLFLASHTDVAGLAAGVLLGVYCGQTHQLVPADLSHCAQRQV